MTRTPARITQADVARAVRAAKQAGAGDVVIETDGRIVIRLVAGTIDTAPKIAPVEDIIL
jgi:hypothetical protein